MNKIFILASLFASVSNSRPNCDISIKISIGHYARMPKNGETEFVKFDYDVYLAEELIENGQLTQKTNFGTFEAKNIDCMGAMSFVLSDTIQNKRIIEKLINSPDTLKKLIIVVDPITNDEWKIVAPYFEPIEDSIWVFQDLNLNIADTVTFKKGWKSGK